MYLPLPNQPATVHGQRGSVYAGGVLAAQEHGERRDLIGGYVFFDGCFSSTCSMAAASRDRPCSAALASICLSIKGVRTLPGQMALQVISNSAISRVTSLVRPRMPCLAAT